MLFGFFSPRGVGGRVVNQRKTEALTTVRIRKSLTVVAGCKAPVSHIEVLYASLVRCFLPLSSHARHHLEGHVDLVSISISRMNHAQVH